MGDVTERVKYRAQVFDSVINAFFRCGNWIQSCSSNPEPTPAEMSRSSAPRRSGRRSRRPRPGQDR